MLWHAIWNLFQTKYGVEPTNDILRDGMRNGFERMGIVYESLVDMERFLIYTPYIYIYIYIFSLHFVYVLIDGT